MKRVSSPDAVTCFHSEGSIEDALACEGQPSHSEQ